MKLKKIKTYKKFRRRIFYILNLIISEKSCINLSHFQAFLLIKKKDIT